MVEQAECVEGVPDDLCNGPGRYKQKDTVLTLDLGRTGGGGGGQQKRGTGARGGAEVSTRGGGERAGQLVGGQP